MSEEQEMVGGGDGWEGDGGVGWQDYQFCSNPEGSRYVEAAGKGAQVHGNSEIIEYACNSDLNRMLWLEGK